jgi:hypothetical protein
MIAHLLCVFFVAFEFGLQRFIFEQSANHNQAHSKLGKNLKKLGVDLEKEE